MLSHLSEPTHLPFIAEEKSSVPIKRVALNGLRTINYLNTCNEGAIKPAHIVPWTATVAWGRRSKGGEASGGLRWHCVWTGETLKATRPHKFAAKKLGILDSVCCQNIAGLS